ncbi:galactose oxidase [Shewanella sp. D64]|uniref:Kelch repeat-containing protein n=1 Tax=unclassified Shewanella TaxID=196818 RepID=UPI0022BA5C02|nr:MULTISPECIES: kelch repeat-containing protein [unclassified Shewanella]MEC4726164.1 galactose oxidase [Shewanella sp. D64]MEC4737920.1 galactose oxidase [Shewanella sp. E94]WBJ96122.1 galactose oxidase [Shewanella sp. MTB7]
MHKHSALLLLFFPLLASANSPNVNLPNLPEPVTNNAIALATSEGEHYLFSFMGLNSDKGHQAIHNRAWRLKLNEPNTQWQTIANVPHIEELPGRLASIAVGIKDKVYIFGGYTVSKDHHEVSTSDNYRYALKDNTYTRIADMPVAVDDTAAFSYQQRYIYLFGGWHQHGNVNLVQVYDTQTDRWSQATPIPAPAVFGQAVAAVSNELVLCDGVTVEARLEQARAFTASPICLYGKIQTEDHLKIDWQALPHYSLTAPFLQVRNSTIKLDPKAHYRMAATGDAPNQQLIFMAGSDNPYNYDGIGYNGQPSSPSNSLYRFDLKSHTWLTPVYVKQASMDHRGLMFYQNNLLRVGGMLEQQQVSDAVLTTPINDLAQ